VTLAVAAIAGLGIAVMLNAAAGGSAGAPAALKTKEQLAASSRALPARVDHPVSTVKAAPAAKRHARRHHARKSHRAATPAPSPAPTRAPEQHLVAVRTPAPQPVSQPAPAPVVHKPAPAPKPAPSGKSGGGDAQFDDSG
jgi:hypothetical protein